MVESRFSLHLMLVGSSSAVKTLRRKAAGFDHRIVFEEPVAVENVATALNPYDVELIFFPPVTENLRHALPNKFFQSIQGRLGIVIGESPDMAELVAEFDNGIVVKGWSPTDLAAAINALDVAQIGRLKAASGVAAAELNSAREKSHFFAAAGLDR